MTNRRTFIKQASMVLSAATVTPLFAENSIELLTEKLAAHSHLSAEELAKDEVFWNWVRMNYLTGTDIINFNSGGVSPHAKPVQEMVEKLTTLSNYAPSYYMWRVLEKDREAIRTKLAAMAGVDAEEIAINRNTTEGLDTIIFGLNLKNGDEIVHSNFIYPNMNQAWMQREMRDGVVRKIAQLKLPSTDTNALVKA
ncbi:MAG: aminotransferase, partial [Salibacteraceae bacterium]|nr:aminotransferase [Salibacteraceae bacterium]